MRSRLLNLRLWLEKTGLFPKGKLAFITWYLLGLDLVLFVIQKTTELFRSSFGKYLTGWVVFLSDVFIGVIPTILLVSLGLGTFYLFVGQFATYIVTSRLDSELKSLQTGNFVIARQIAANPTGDGSTRAGELGPGDPQVSVWMDGKFLFNDPPENGAFLPRSLPGYLPSQFASVVRDQGILFLRSALSIPTAKGKLTVICSKTLDQRMLLNLAANLGEVTLFSEHDAAGEPKPSFSVGDVPTPESIMDLKVNFAASIPVVNWASGGTSDPPAIGVLTRLFRLYARLSSALGDYARPIELSLLIAAMVFGMIELIALWIGTRLTRSVTGAVAQLYQATTHINRGDFSHRIPITSKDQLAALASSFNLMTESIEKLILDQKAKQRLENEITIAQEVQAQLFPRHISQLPSLEVHGFCRPARSVSGDYYDAVRAYSIEGIPALRQAQAVGAGPVFAAAYDPIIPGAEVSPGTLLSLLNHQLYHSTPMEKYATLFLAMYDGRERRLTFSNAGHLPPLVLGARGSIRRLEDGGTVVGLFDEVRYDEGSVQLRPGELFLAYSDGVTEPENDFGEFGERRLIELVQENRDLPLDRITEIVTAAVDDWIGGAEQPDDVTLVLARAR